MVVKSIVLGWRAVPKWFIILAFVFMMAPLFWATAGFPMLIIPFSVFLYFSLSTYLFIVSKNEELYILSQTLPIKRSELVKGRYVFSLIMLLVGLTVGIVLTFFANIFAPFIFPHGIRDYTLNVIISILSFAIFHVFIYPLMFKLECQKAETLVGIFTGVFTGFLFGIYFLILRPLYYMRDYIMFVSNGPLLLSVGLIVLAILLMLVSYVLSMKVFSQRDF